MIIIQFILLFLQSMKNKKKQIIPAFTTHPSELIKDELTERKMTQKELAELTGIKPSILSETINGKRSISLNMATALESVLGIPTTLWMNLQTQYNIDSANIAEKNNQRETIAVTIPVSDRNLLRDLAHKFGWACML